jgi:hypothetical protein
VLGGIAAGRIFAWCVQQWWESDVDDSKVSRTTSNGITTSSNDEYDASNGAKGKDVKKRKNPRKNAPVTPAKTRSKGGGTSFDGIVALKHAVDTASSSKEGLMVRRTLTVVAALLAYTVGTNFTKYCWRLSKDLSNPSIIIQGRLKDGSVVTVDDYREAYWWLRDNTPEDARIMAWWDYGYQITGMFVRLGYRGERQPLSQGSHTLLQHQHPPYSVLPTGISNRTTIADGNTWNHERKFSRPNFLPSLWFMLTRDFVFCSFAAPTTDIALLGLALTTDVSEGYEIGE